jgi:hypothetical protein
MPDVLSKDGFCFSALRDVGLYFVTLTQIEINDVIFLVFSRPATAQICMLMRRHMYPSHRHGTPQNGHH